MIAKKTLNRLAESRTDTEEMRLAKMLAMHRMANPLPPVSYRVAFARPSRIVWPGTELPVVDSSLVLD